ncbi:hypothetical protein C2845_PM18G05960 [Panicum miliaceum]|uniref:Rx N-terminal domain-containing protein n=1 Tax=Panicum miliaceum TaxID=4540 RepID=A0A3L6PLT5_PANMI|nr:hypothetical protein C2845_PM18G05960 [Panicum miliaceum]
MVGSAVIQEVVSRVSSFVLGKREDKESKEHIIERLEMALAELEFALERSVKLPITDVSLLHRRKVIKHAYTEAASLLHKHKWQSQQEDKEIERISHGRSLSFLSLIGLKKDESLCLSCSDVRRFEWFADCAGKFVRDVESGWRGVEAELQYCYEDHKMPEKGFRLALMLRLSESTDIAGIAVKWLLSLASHFKLVTGSATGELSLLPNLLDISNSYAPSLIGIQLQYIRHSDIFRQDPEGLQESYACEVTGFEEHRRDGSIQEMTELVRSQASNHFVREPELTDYGMLWISAHGCAYYVVQKINSEMTSVSNADGRLKTQRVAKRRRRSCV